MLKYMTQIWTFSPSSEAQLQKCIAASLPPDDNNKWVREFLRKKDENDSTHNLSEKKCERIDCSEESAKTDSQDNYEEFIETIENEYMPRLDCIIEECCKNNNLFIYLAQRLSTPSIEKICKQVCLNTTSDDFLMNFYTIFIPTTIKRNYCRYVLDFLVQSRENHKRYLQILLDILIVDTAIPRNVLNDYFLTLNEQEQVELMKYMLNMDMNAELMANNIPVVYIIYKKCSISKDIQSKMLSNLIQTGECCKNDRLYGKLLLAFLQTEKSTDFRLNKKTIESIVEKHRSAFRRPCEIILNELIQDNVKFD